jgi:hypothetical protein
VNQPDAASPPNSDAGGRRLVDVERLGVEPAGERHHLVAVDHGGARSNTRPGPRSSKAYPVEVITPR